MFTKILIANRGEIACRIARTCKRLGISTVAVYSDADKDALHVRMADEAVRIGPPPVKDSYLSIEAVIAAARETGAQAIHPGYGLLSEKEAFARAVIDAGLAFIGPPLEALAAFGDKIKAREVAKSVGVEPPPGTEGPIAADDLELARREAERIGLPLLVKAAGGGGGIGMQIVEDMAKLERAITACSDRGKQAFGDPRVYLERYLAAPKHIEVQVLCDGQGGAVALGERECSVQRRHQKIVEESPSAAQFFLGELGEARRDELFDRALRVVKRAGYVGAGTVEFVASSEGDIFFLEVNARLQVEHCVTEMVTGIDLVEQQIRIAAGDRIGSDVIGAKREGHSIEARIYAEDPAKRFAPQPGRIEKLTWPEPAMDLRVETGVAEGLEVTPFYDPLLAKIVAWGRTRDEAIKRLDGALAATTLELVGPAGPAATNIAFLRRVLASDAFTTGRYDTHFAEALAKEKR
ncbi:acetyl-CoA carboxylase biotin carboxylase subunit [Polyangium aurulentum]|uniref:acetyl-CoA carboxylase biotin carboxylase subunit n=1 Tax=Polyangium aurulentum TaxID=2567896 RepID=UPI0010AEE6A5|nr:biotin carboxylase N-terminal domain-containing protein [Polyangium aurulentum]UQA55648.1 ATP-grasp domain-containing protein [Polyangium aurulentum]